MDVLLVLLRFVERFLPPVGLLVFGLWWLLHKKPNAGDATVVHIGTPTGWRVFLATKSVGLICIVLAGLFWCVGPHGPPVKIERHTSRTPTQVDPNSPTGQSETRDDFWEYWHRDSSEQKTKQLDK
jgi:hypothetical protein